MDESDLFMSYCLWLFQVIAFEIDPRMVTLSSVKETPHLGRAPKEYL